MISGRQLVDSFFDGFGPGALFARPKRAGRPRRVFAERCDEPVSERPRTMQAEAGSARPPVGELAQRGAKG
jgi:hypothetical protein